MLAILLICILGWIFAIAGWRMESNYRRKLVDSIKKDFYSEIKWIKSRHYEDVMAREIDVYKRAIKIVDAYNFDREGVEDEEDSIQ
jgi:hypothetical protein